MYKLLECVTVNTRKHSLSMDSFSAVVVLRKRSSTKDSFCQPMENLLKKFEASYRNGCSQNHS